MDASACWQLPVLGEGDRLCSDGVNPAQICVLSLHMLSAREIKTDGLVMTFAILSPVSTVERNNSCGRACVTGFRAGLHRIRALGTLRKDCNHYKHCYEQINSFVWLIHILANLIIFNLNHIICYFM